MCWWEISTPFPRSFTSSSLARHPAAAAAVSAAGRYNKCSNERLAVSVAFALLLRPVPAPLRVMSGPSDKGVGSFTAI